MRIKEHTFFRMITPIGSLRLLGLALFLIFLSNTPVAPGIIYGVEDCCQIRKCRFTFLPPPQREFPQPLAHVLQLKVREMA